MPNSRIQEKKRDFFYRLAKKEGYRSRASFKLLQANLDSHFMKEGDVVVDLGAAPGGWMQAASEIVGAEGFVFGVDLLSMRRFDSVNIASVVSDIKDPGILLTIRNKVKGKVDVVLSDVSPNVSGIWEVDHARQIDLARTSLDIARKILKTDGAFFCKVFQGDLLDEFLRELKNSLRVVKLVKPKASKAQSSELYVLGLFLKTPHD